MTDLWPDLPYPAWSDTATTLQLWMQIVGKVRLRLTPWINHGWHATLYVTARGLTTSTMPIGGELLEIEFDFVGQRLIARTSRDDEQAFALEPQRVSDFYHRVGDLLNSIGVWIKINEMPSELANPIPFSQDRTHSAYDPAAAHRFWRALVQIDRVFKQFRTGFIGK